jgi:uncharacterized protein
MPVLAPRRVIESSGDKAVIVEDQREILAYLGQPSAYGVGVERVERIDTHSASVFLAGDRAYKLKHAVRYPFLDYGTLERRKTFSEREVALNRRTAPELYLGVAAVTREADGRLMLGGSGEPVEWLVVMRRFRQEDLLDSLARRGALDQALVLALADAVGRFHAAAERTPQFGGKAGISKVVEGNAAELAALPPGLFEAADVAQLTEISRRAIATHAGLLEARRQGGMVRHCHGDLHLNNVCRINGEPTLFDAIEFDAELASIDVLYDLAFLLMDILHRERRDTANQLMNRYLEMTRDYTGLALLPLFLATRAAVRAKIRALGAEADPQVAACREARSYLALALAVLKPGRARLIAIGGLSGTGKSTLARALAPEIGPAPGAAILRSDSIRKLLAGVPQETRLPASAYTPEMNRRVYAELAARAGLCLAAGHTAIVDAVFAGEAERREIQAVAAAAPFTGLWLEARPELLAARIDGRRGDASDATVEVMRRQLGYDLGRMEWRRIEVSGEPERALMSARTAIGGEGG